ncbi:FkbM family methyltransferase [Acidobacteriota bacterium]
MLHLKAFARRCKRLIFKSPTSKDVLVYLGLNKGEMFGRLFAHYRQSYGFEADPEMCRYLSEKYTAHKTVHIVNAAVTTEDVDRVKYFITDNDSASSSLYRLKDEWQSERARRGLSSIKARETSVPGINLLKFLTREGVESITDYISDVEGMDLAVLRTIEEYIKEKRIVTITCEVSKSRKHNRHAGCPDNSLEGFMELLDENYELIAQGFMPLRDGQFQEVPKESWAMDCKWRLRER